jgi:DNA-directed RNA polymerase specialized sigma24 family protein
MPNKEIAEHMGVSLVTVENQITRGIHLCRDFLEARGVKGFNRE